MKRVTLLFATVAAAWIGSSGPASASCYVLEDGKKACTEFEVVEGRGFGLVVSREQLQDGTIITKYVGGMIRKDYVSGETRLFQGKPVTMLTGSLPGKLRVMQSDTSSGTLGR